MNDSVFPAHQAGMTSRQRFLRACRCAPVDRPPLWMMRQAGRSLPEYRKLKERYSFLELVRTPELAAEVTLQPIRRFEFDAAIIFSDILVIPEALGIGYTFREQGGIAMDFKIVSDADVRKLSAAHLAEKLAYVSEAIRLTRRELGEETALLGFAGSPWTLANYVLDGGSAPAHTRAVALFEEDRALFEQLCEKLTDAIVTFLRLQIHAGVDAVQIFDSLGGLLPNRDFRAASGVWMRDIVAGLAGEVPVIVFSKGARDWNTLAYTGADVFGIDAETRLPDARERLGPACALQGNLDPACLVTNSPEQVAKRVRDLLTEMDGQNGFIFNLGHGVPPDARLENIRTVAETVRANGATSAKVHTRNRRTTLSDLISTDDPICQP